MKRCHKCGTPWTSEKKQPAVKEYCDACSAYLHCCLNCRFHDKNVHNQCRIGTTDWVGDRAGANFCDEFEFADTDSNRQLDPSAKSAKDTLESLFGPADEQEPGLDEFKKLFGE